MKTILALIIIIVAGCSNRQIYDSVKANQKNECEKLPQSQYRECMQDAEKSYHEYQQEREEIISDKS